MLPRPAEGGGSGPGARCVVHLGGEPRPPRAAVRARGAAARLRQRRSCGVALLNTQAGSSTLHVPPTRVLHAVAAPPSPQTPALSTRGTPVSEVRRRALEARAAAEALRRQNHQLQGNLTPIPARASALARARSLNGGSGLSTPLPRPPAPASDDGSRGVGLAL